MLFSTSVLCLLGYVFTVQQCPAVSRLSQCCTPANFQTFKKVETQDTRNVVRGAVMCREWASGVMLPVNLSNLDCVKPHLLVVAFKNPSNQQVVFTEVITYSQCYSQKENVSGDIPSSHAPSPSCIKNLACMSESANGLQM